VPGVTAIKVGGHFEGSMVLHWDGHLFVADTFVNVPVSSDRLLFEASFLVEEEVLTMVDE